MSLVTNEFWKQGNFVARAAGMSDAPRVELPHPVAGSGEAKMFEVAQAIVPRLLAVFSGNQRGEVRW